ncbi:MAG: GTP cyclohydrolase I [Clostridia bacterium]|nr:GTP cyclohydrolase I [Clostridia bacterium]
MLDKEKIKKLTHEFLVAIGENPEREGLKNTPERVANMCEEMFSGLGCAEDNLITTFSEPNSSGNTVEITKIPLRSICEHHLLPFFGFANIKYIPKNGKILGLSKFARIVDFLAKKPHVQENLTSEITDYLWEVLEPIGVEVSLECTHTCMTIRGVKAENSTTKTTVKRGDI